MAKFTKSKKQDENISPWARVKPIKTVGPLRKRPYALVKKRRRCLKEGEGRMVY